MIAIEIRLSNLLKQCVRSRSPTSQLRVLDVVGPVVLDGHRLQRVQERVIVQAVHLVRVVPDRAVVDVPAGIRFAQRLGFVQIEIPPVEDDQRG